VWCPKIIWQAIPNGWAGYTETYRPLYVDCLTGGIDPQISNP